MAKFAVLIQNCIMNTIIADSKEIAEEATNAICVEVPEDVVAGIGFIYVNGEFIAPLVEVTND